jgi:Holliday junction DNA helicase RuvA
MIGHLRGSVLALSPERLLLDVQGVGYELQVPLSTFYELERAKSAPEVRLFVHTHVREDDITLFGFWTETEKRLFERLIGVSGIGPRLARSILSGMASEDLAMAIAGGDLGRLSTIPGVGKKTAERLVLELRDKMRDFAANEKAAAAPAGGDVVSALINLGYKPANAERAVAEARRAAPEAPFHDLLRAALKQLSHL